MAEVSQTTQFTDIQQAYVNAQPIISEWTNNTAFYALYPRYYFSFANRWLRKWLGWYDGYVWGLHDGAGGLLSTRIGTTLVKRLTQQVYGSGLFFEKDDDNHESHEALDKINYWSKMTGFANKIQTGIEFAGAGGTSALKLNVSKSKKINIKNDIWCEVFRADNMYLDIDFKGEVTKARFLINRYTRTVPNRNNETDYFYIVEDRYFDCNELGEQKPYVQYCIFKIGGDIANKDVPYELGRSLTWAEIPKDISKSIREEYGVLEVNKKQLLPFSDLGVFALKWTNFVSNLPMLQFGESLLAPIQTYLFMYDYMFSCFNTDMYLGRGRVLMPKQMQRPKGKGTSDFNWNTGYDSFLYSMYESFDVDGQKPTPLQFELRSAEWTSIRNNLLESMATAIGISPSTIASYLNDASNRTAREISSEESSTTLYIEAKRDLLKEAINKCIDAVLHYYGFSEDISIKFSKAGQTNISVAIENTTKKLQAGLISKISALKELNPDMTQDQIDNEYNKIMADERNKQQTQQSDLFGNLKYSDENGDFVNGQQTDTNGKESGSELASVDN